MADVVPLRRPGAPEFGPPAASFSDVADPARTLSVTWSADARSVRLGIGASEGPSTALVLDADHVLDLVRVLVDGLPRPGSPARPPAPVVPLTPRRD